MPLTTWPTSPYRIRRAIALDDDLVGAAAQHGAAPPAFPWVDRIAQAHRELAKIDLPFEGVEFAIPVHHGNPAPFLLPVFLAVVDPGLRRRWPGPVPLS